MRKLFFFLSGGKAAFISMTLWSLACLVILFIPAKDFSLFKEIKWLHMSVFGVLAGFLLLCLACVLLKRILRFRFTIKNISFIINHFGLLLVILFLSLSQWSMQKLYCSLIEQENSSIAMDVQGYAFQLPFSITLNKTWAATVFSEEDSDLSLREDTLGKKLEFKETSTYKTPNKISEKSEAIKNFYSNFIIHQGEKKLNVTISVNHPFTLEEWSLYQYSFYPKNEYTPARTTLLLVRNPWVNGVYIGIILCLLGAVISLFTLKNKRSC